MSLITSAGLKEVLHYHPETGIFTWNVQPHKRIALGSRAGCLKANGYIYIKIDGKAYLAHRLAWLYVNGEWPVNEIDHVNVVSSDNRIENLRGATSSENKHNKLISQITVSGFLGVCRKGKRWQAQIELASKKHYIGLFDTPEEASAAYWGVKKIYHPSSPSRAT